MWHEIHEVYYGDDDEIEGWTVNPIAPRGDSPLELVEDLDHIKAAIKQPILDLEELERAMASNRKKAGRRGDSYSQGPYVEPGGGISRVPW